MSDPGESSLDPEVLMLVSPLTFAGSFVEVPPGPGLGVEVDEDAVRRRALR